ASFHHTVAVPVAAAIPVAAPLALGYTHHGHGYAHHGHGLDYY
ncbi:unnamed protein product, partial [Allacma fusca]